MLCALRAYRLAIAIYGIAVFHVILLSVGSLFAKQFPSERNPMLRRPMIQPIKTKDDAIILVICYLVFFYVWHAFPLVIDWAPAIRQIWYSSSFLGLSLTTIEHSVLAAMHVFLYVNYFGDCHGTGYVSPKNCAMTSCLSLMLIATHFAVPWV
ncbi:MAG: hypothetical protein N2C14_11610 [Planctomycetales bacterium]